MGLASLAGLALLIYGCRSTQGSGPSFKNETAIIPQHFPGKTTTGITFPEYPSVIYDWLKNEDTSSIAQHTWGIWSGLTSKTDQVYGGDTLLLFETWMGAHEIREILESDGNDISTYPYRKTSRTPLSIPTQLSHGVPLENDRGSESLSNSVDRKFQRLVTVCYSPPSAEFAINNRIFDPKVLLEYKPENGEIGAMPSFPSNSINIKPTYFTVANKGTDPIVLPIWPGPPDTIAKITGWDTFWQYVFIDPTNSQPANKIPVLADSMDATGETQKRATVNLNDFIYFYADSAMANQFNNEQGSDSISPGDLAILVGMHVTTKEIQNWTWQTFFWAPDPQNPPFPSSSFTAGHRLPKTQLSSAAQHYAAVPVYNMVWPNQPINGGTNTGVSPLIGYNPYLEAELNKFTVYDSLNPKFIYGVRSNCMSCHSLAAYKFEGQSDFRYSGDQYISRNSSLFNGYVQLDFAWSVLAEAIEFKKK